MNLSMSMSNSWLHMIEKFSGSPVSGHEQGKSRERCLQS